MKNNISEILISKNEIKTRTTEIAKQIEKEYGKTSPILFICILRGAYIFFADLTTKLNMPIEVDFMAISSYGTGTKSSGEVKIVKDLKSSIEGKHVIVVEDIIDSGYTIKYLKNLLFTRNPASLKICSLLNKQERREVNIKADYVGFEVPDKFIVGYGLDYAEQYRNLPFIGVLDPKAYQQ